MMLFESLIFNLLPAAVGIMAVVLVFESCWRKCPPDKLMIVSGAGKMRSVSGKGTFVIPLLQRVDTLSLGAVQVQLTTENDIPTQDAILIHACAVANFQIGQTPELIETASKNYLNLDKEEMTRQVTEVMLGKMRGTCSTTPRSSPRPRPRSSTGSSPTRPGTTPAPTPARRSSSPWTRPPWSGRSASSGPRRRPSATGSGRRLRLGCRRRNGIGGKRNAYSSTASPAPHIAPWRTRRSIPSCASAA